MNRIAVLVICLITFALPAACVADPDLSAAKSKDGVLHLLSFEPDEIEAIGKVFKGTIKQGKLKDGTSATSLTVRGLGNWTMVRDDDSKRGNSFILHRVRVNYFKKFDVPQAALDYYGIDQDHWSQCLRTAGSFRRLFPLDWSAFEVLRFDVFARDVPVTVRIALEDEEIAPPVVRNFKLEPGSWRTCEVDLLRAVKMRGLNLRRMATLSIAIVETHEMPPRDAPYLARLDRVRLSAKSHPVNGKVVRDDSSHKLPLLYQPSAGPKPERLPAGAPDRSPLDAAAPITITTEKPYCVNWTGFISAYDNKHLLVGLATTGGTAAKTGVLQTTDGGKSWKGLDGTKSPTWLSTPYPDHQAAAASSVGKRSDVLLFTNLGCNGQKMASLRLFSRHLEFTGNGWQLRQQPALVDCDLRHCNSNQSVVRSDDGRLWAAYGMVGRLGTNCINARFSDDDGRTWKSSRPGTSGLVTGTLHSEEEGVSFGRYTFEEPCIVPLGKGIACLWQNSRGPLRWTRFDGKTWTPIEIVETPKWSAYNPTRPVIKAVHIGGREIFLVSSRFDGVYHWTDGKWTLEAKDVPSGSRISISGGKNVAVISTGIRESRDYKNHQGPVTFSMWRRQSDGTWQGPKKLVTEEHPLTRNDNPYAFRPSFVVQPYAPANFIPLAWTCEKQNFVKVLRIPVR